MNDRMGADGPPTVGIDLNCTQTCQGSRPRTGRGEVRTWSDRHRTTYATAQIAATAYRSAWGSSTIMGVRVRRGGKRENVGPHAGYMYPFSRPFPAYRTIVRDRFDNHYGTPEAAFSSAHVPRLPSAPVQGLEGRRT